MKRFLLFCMMVVIISGVSASAGAASFDFGDNSYWELGTGWVGQGDTYSLDAKFGVVKGAGDIAFDLSTGEKRDCIKWGWITFGESFIDARETDNLEVAAFIDFDLPADDLVQLPGNALAIKGRTSDNGLDLMINFDPVQVAFGDNGLFTVGLKDVKFRRETSHKRAIYAWVELNQDTKPQSVPEPATLILIGSGLLSIGAFRMKKFRK